MIPPKVVLVQPQIPANIGFIARLMANYGLSDWAMVSGPAISGSEAEKTGVSAPLQMQSISRVDSLKDALVDCHYSIAFTARQGKHRQPIELPQLFTNDLNAISVQHRLAFVFGREDCGLSTEEVEQCSCIATIPLPGLESLNLSHAVALVLQEWHSSIHIESGNCAGDLQSGELSQLATDAERRRVFAKALNVITAAKFPDRGEELSNTIRRLTALPIQSRDIKTIEKIIRHMKHLDYH